MSTLEREIDEFETLLVRYAGAWGIAFNEVTALLMNNGCTINKPAMYELAIYIIEREKAVLENMKLQPPLPQ